MLIKSMIVRNFRCYREATLLCEPLTAIVGRNGSGKSTLLKALDIFYDTKAVVTADDFYSTNTSIPIEICVTYGDLSYVELQEFASYLDNDTLTVTKRIYLDDGKVDQKYFAATRQVPKLAKISKMKSKAERRKAWNELEIGTKASTGDEADRLIAEYTSAHPEETQLIEQEEQFFGPKNIGGGRLDKFSKFIYIPAVRDASEDIAEKRGSPLYQLLEMLAMRRFQARNEVRQLKQEFSQRLGELYCAERLQEFKELADEISHTLKLLAPGSALGLKPSLPSLPDIPAPALLPTLLEDNYEGPVDRKGHGLQRLLIFSLLRHLAVAQPLDDDQRTELNEQDSLVEISRNDTKGPETGVEPSPPKISEIPYPGPDLIIAIEEPELYQHPLQARHLAEVLLNMSRENQMGLGGRNQILYTTHSAYFVDLDRFDQLRITCKVHPRDGAASYTRIAHYSLDQACNELWRISGQPAKLYSAQSFRARAYPVMNSSVNEGFFADAVVLVEGLTETAALLKVAEIQGRNWLAKGIAVIPVGGKSNIDRPAVIFQGFGIPTYVVFDGDKGKKKGKDRDSEANKNRRLLRLLGGKLEDFPATGVYDKYACFEKDFETYCKCTLGTTVYRNLLEPIMEQYGYSSLQDGVKSYAVVSDFVSVVYEQGFCLLQIEEIVEKVSKLETPAYSLH